jgi:hypothetical protein
MPLAAAVANTKQITCMVFIDFSPFGCAVVRDGFRRAFVDGLLQKDFPARSIVFHLAFARFAAEQEFAGVELKRGMLRPSLPRPRSIAGATYHAP